MTVKELRALIADAPDEAVVVVVTDTMIGTTETVYGGDSFSGYPPSEHGEHVFLDGQPFVQLVLDSALEAD